MFGEISWNCKWKQQKHNDKTLKLRVTFVHEHKFTLQKFYFTTKTKLSLNYLRMYSSMNRNHFFSATISSLFIIDMERNYKKLFIKLYSEKLKFCQLR